MACGHSCTLRRNPLQTPVRPSSGPSPCQASPHQPPRGVTGTGGPIRESAEETQWLRGKSPNPHCHDYKELRLLNFSWQLIPSAFWALWYLCCSRFLPLICLFLMAAVSLSVKWGSCGIKWDNLPRPGIAPGGERVSAQPIVLSLSRLLLVVFPAPPTLADQGLFPPLTGKPGRLLLRQSKLPSLAAFCCPLPVAMWHSLLTYWILAGKNQFPDRNLHVWARYKTRGQAIFTCPPQLWANHPHSGYNQMFHTRDSNATQTVAYKEHSVVFTTEV